MSIPYSEYLLRCWSRSFFLGFFFFNDTATTEIYTLSLHDALPISSYRYRVGGSPRRPRTRARSRPARSEEHTSELQSHHDLVCRLLLEKKKKQTTLPTLVLVPFLHLPPPASQARPSCQSLVLSTST